MDDTEAKLRLSACRPGGLDADDPAIREALHELGRSPALNAWFEQEQAFDGAMASHVRRIPIPDGLRTEIVAAAKVSRRPQWVRQVASLAAIAAILVATYGAGIFVNYSFPSSPPTFAEYRGAMPALFGRMKEKGIRFDERGGGVNGLNAFLVKNQAPSADTLQPGLRLQSEPLGCHILEWRGRKVSMICFAKEGEEAHLFVIDRDAISDAPDAHPSPQHPQIKNGYPITTWVDARHAYVLVGNSPQTDLTKFL